MFSALKRPVAQRLAFEGKLFGVGAAGERVDYDDAAGVLAVLGPVPLPLRTRRASLEVDWYPFVRRATDAEFMEVSALTYGTSALPDLMAILSVGSLLVARCPSKDTHGRRLRIHAADFAADVFQAPTPRGQASLADAYEMTVSAGGALAHLHPSDDTESIWSRAALLADAPDITVRATGSEYGLSDTDIESTALVLLSVLGDRVFELYEDQRLLRAPLRAHGVQVVMSRPDSARA